MLAFFWLVSAPLSCIFGPYALSVRQVLSALGAIFGFSGTPTQNDPALLVVNQIRLARACLALLCGGALGLAGATLQGVLRNPLADPFTLGISAGAACGASLAMTAGADFALALGLSHSGLVALAALLGALLALLASIWLGYAGAYFSRESVILAGIAVAAFLGALVALIKALNEESVSSIVFWIMGSFQGRGWDSLPLFLGMFMPGLVVVALGWRKLDLLALGREQACALGLDVRKVRIFLLVGASLMTAGCVAVAGVIGFVGLLVPHALRFFLGFGHGLLLLGSFFFGGILLLWADMLARSLLSGGQELPVGVVMALLGAPCFAFLVKKR